MTENSLTSHPAPIALKYIGIPEQRAAAEAALRALMGAERFLQREDGCLVFDGTETDLAPVWQQLKGWARYRSEAETQVLYDTLAGIALFGAVVGMGVTILFLDGCFYLDSLERHREFRPLISATVLGPIAAIAASVLLTMALVTFISPVRPRWKEAAKVAIEPLTRVFRKLY